MGTARANGMTTSARNEARMKVTTRDEISSRLCSIEGHLHGLQGMVRTNRPCSETLTQIAAIQCALRQVALTLIEVEIDSCLRQLERSGTSPELERAFCNLLTVYEAGWQTQRGR